MEADKDEVKVKLPCGKVCLINKRDEHLLKKFPHWRSNKGRVVVTRYIKTEYGVVRQDLHLARVIVMPPRQFVVDHKDQNPLNNKRSNLRLATHSQNNVNRSKQKGATSIYFGVSKNSVCKKRKWSVFIRTKSGNRSHGTFECEKEAARHADKISNQEWGEFAPKNFRD